jgi:hypothetical protein
LAHVGSTVPKVKGEEGFVLVGLSSMFATVNVAALIFTIILTVAVSSVVLFFSVKAGRRLRSEVQSERASQPIGQGGPAQTRAKRLLVVGVILALLILPLSAIAAFSSRNYGSVPTWDSTLIAILFWGGVLFLLIRFVVEKRRRKWRGP